MPCFTLETAHFSRIRRRFSESRCADAIGLCQCLEPVRIGKVAKSGLASGAERKAWNKPLFFVGGRAEWKRVFRRSDTFLGTHQNQPLPVLGHSIVCGVQNLPRPLNGVARLIESRDQFIQKLLLFTECETFYILENEGCSIEFCYDANELEYEAVSRIFDDPLANERKTLARWTAKDTIYSSFTDTGRATYLFGTQTLHRPGNNRRVRKIELVNCAMYWIDLNRGGHIETGLLESEAHSSGSGE